MNSQSKRDYAFIALGSLSMFVGMNILLNRLSRRLAMEQEYSKGLRDSYRAILLDVQPYLTDEQWQKVLDNANFRAIMVTGGIEPDELYKNQKGIFDD